MAREGHSETWIMWSMHPLHFGTLWGMPFKILWFLLGLSLAVLSVTGVLMYWNRYLRHKIS
ncbi:MAG TPA: PepSY-associated TM helix domain-containing protein [Edaphobacter sp.]|nr:PepSY-associated TM helix domain-containing protein [Edaphobacter sp.]